MKKLAIGLKTVTILASILFISSGAYANKEITKAGAFRIKLKVSANANIQKEIRKGFENQLTSHNDVIFVDEDVEYEISISAIEKRVNEMQKPYIILSVNISTPFIKDAVDTEQLLTQMNPFQASYMRNFFLNARVMLDHQLKFVEPDKLTGMCKEIAVDFDKKYLEKTRKMSHRTNEKSE